MAIKTRHSTSIKDVIDLLKGMKNNPDKYRLIHWECSREVVEDPLETYLTGNMYTCYKPGPTIDIHLTIGIKEKT